MRPFDAYFELRRLVAAERGPLGERVWVEQLEWTASKLDPRIYHARALCSGPTRFGGGNPSWWVGVTIRFDPGEPPDPNDRIVADLAETILREGRRRGLSLPTFRIGRSRLRLVQGGRA